jgi:hypothetical protein
MKLSLRRKTNNDIPPWVKVNSRGTLYVDTSDQRYNQFMIAMILYLNQWKINKNGGLSKTNDQDLLKPNWRDFV